IFACIGKDPIFGYDFFEQAGIRRLIIIPHGRLQYLPLHAAQHPNGQYLCDRFEVCYSPSLAMISRNIELERRWGERALVVANPDGTLAESHRDVEAVVGNFMLPLVLGPGEASVAEVLEKIQNSEVAHFACHGIFDRRGISHTGLMLADG